jgi:hypothetical protein
MNFDITNPAEGIYPGLPEPVYRSAPGISQSNLKEVLVSPLHYWTKINSPPTPPTPAQRIGTITHSLVLQNKVQFVVLPEDAPKKPTKAQRDAKKPSPDTVEAIAWWDKFEANNKGREVLDKEEAAHIYGMRQSVLDHPIAGEILRRATSAEVAAFKRHESTGLLMKGLADVVCTDDNNYITIPDLKTCQYGCASKEEFSKQIFNWGYAFQAAYYLDLFGASFFIFIAVEKEPPYAVATYRVEADTVALGREAYEKCLQKVKQCMDDNKWPAYSQELELIGVPEWAKKRSL